MYPKEGEWQRLKEAVQRLKEEIVCREQDDTAWEQERDHLQRVCDHWKEQESLEQEWEQTRRRLVRELEQYTVLEALEKQCADLEYMLALVNEKVAENQRLTLEKKNEEQALNRKLELLQTVEVDLERLSGERKETEETVRKGRSCWQIRRASESGRNSSKRRRTATRWRKPDGKQHEKRQTAGRRRFFKIRLVCWPAGWQRGCPAQCAGPEVIQRRQSVRKKRCPRRRMSVCRPRQNSSTATVWPWPTSCLSCGDR